MTDIRFDAPITVRSPKGSETRSLRSAQEASDYLMNSWPGKRSPKHRAALQACHDVLEGAKPTISAKRAFIAAAREADVLVRDDAAA